MVPHQIFEKVYSNQITFFKSPAKCGYSWRLILWKVRSGVARPQPAKEEKGKSSQVLSIFTGTGWVMKYVHNSCAPNQSLAILAHSSCMYIRVYIYIYVCENNMYVISANASVSQPASWPVGWLVRQSVSPSIHQCIFPSSIHLVPTQYQFMDGLTRHLRCPPNSRSGRIWERFIYLFHIVWKFHIWLHRLLPCSNFWGPSAAISCSRSRTVMLWASFSVHEMIPRGLGMGMLMSTSADNCTHERKHQKHQKHET